MKIYTKTGDKGQTRIVGKQILYKSAPRVEAYGEVDELNSWVGYVRSLLSPQTKDLSPELEEIQQLLFDCGHDLATPKDEERHSFIFNQEKPTNWLEKKIDDYTAKVPTVKKFILPGGSPVASALHVARSITRRTERRIVLLMQEEEINQDVLTFINRLSDYFFATARYANYLENNEDVLYRNSKDVFR
ncbi:cob(I)yrinic acid a,c-diamide adenosyltransferase [Limosilactobacillus sp. STM2_1]|uniref:Corrinoid adenosyltransferase n=1 Tax=Limosilactobacillus rudii TaxID=2759755 RepID=A0A7W3UKW4_9LACO|nr:cob(I)yrinic acid a,c-diamide adenosyltransferase [Limosilactobacillus rudii]MBB1079413.1 cob(I)yrinic acid a,c-diamide adenosyltransferase [Limosilactobacillus rudii]MBB1097459.1 cob(I)yrinic acid a,c-diamide adenosyltransferase [Limosilactobacillus rudii]MCD7134568.1 cob(I)yrinic acid a,c-diamide adenosyltransferase [Limosilactobacillus rudii]